MGTTCPSPSRTLLVVVLPTARSISARTVRTDLALLDQKQLMRYLGPAPLIGPFDSTGYPVGCKSACEANLDGDPCGWFHIPREIS